MTMFQTIDGLSLTDQQKVAVLEWFAQKLWTMLEEGSGCPEYGGKSYDPLTIDLPMMRAYSYVFNLENGGRSHPFTSLIHLEQQLVDEGIKTIRDMLAEAAAR